MSLTIRNVLDGTAGHLSVHVWGHFIRFVNVKVTDGKDLQNITGKDPGVTRSGYK